MRLLRYFLILLFLNVIQRAILQSITGCVCGCRISCRIVKRKGGSAQLENSRRSNADLLALWEERTQMSLIPQFAPVFERYFTIEICFLKKRLSNLEDWPEGF